jgi:hypothetical protein
MTDTQDFDLRRCKIFRPVRLTGQPGISRLTKQEIEK